MLLCSAVVVAGEAGLHRGSGDDLSGCGGGDARMALFTSAAVGGEVFLVGEDEIADTFGRGGDVVGIGVAVRALGRDLRLMAGRAVLVSRPHLCGLPGGGRHVTVGAGHAHLACVLRVRKLQSADVPIRPRRRYRGVGKQRPPVDGGGENSE